MVTIKAFPTTCDGKVCWNGACAGFGSALVCTLTMDTDKIAGARFISSSLACITAVEPPVIFTWTVALDAPGAVGQVVMDGQLIVAETGQRIEHASRSREGEVVVSANLVRAEGKPGTWRFEAQQGEAIEAGSLRVQQGDVQLLTATSVVFRLKGEAGERVAFSYRIRR